jgi:PAS domain S-box-containing protein
MGNEPVDGVNGLEGSTDGGFRSVAQLNMLHSLAAKLNSLTDVAEIAAAITGELRTIVDYHNCRVYLLQDDRTTLLPIAFRGELFSEYEQETLEQLVTTVGEGITGHVAQTGTSLLAADAREIEFSVTIPGTDDDLLESMLAVPMLVGDVVIGVIVLSSLGYGRFDEDDQRLLEVLGSHAAVAFENAKLFQAEREAAQTSSALLGLSQRLTRHRTVGDILQEALETIPSLVSCSVLAAYVIDPETGGYRLARMLEVQPGIARPRSEIADIPAEVAYQFDLSAPSPFRIPVQVVEQIGAEMHLIREPREALIAPLSWEPDGSGSLALVAPSSHESFSDQDLRLAQGIADITSLALGNARRLSELERFYELVESIDAVFWEAEGSTLAFTFLGGRPEAILGAGASEWPAQGRAWGEHIALRDRDVAVAAIKDALAEGGNRNLEYRIHGGEGAVTWIRDLIHVVRGAQGRRQLRGLMIDITERKRAEQALRESERKYSEAFLREREAAQRLRALDDMKNTFLEAVSHDLRTPLTAILGSSLTLERSGLDMPREDALDLVRRVAANARRLERLLGDLLDLDRLQRGILAPQRRPTELEPLVRRTVDEVDNPTDRPIELDVEPATVSVDGAKVERILENLVSNALRHTPPSAHVWVRARRDDGGMLLVVEDDGPGIPEELREAVFEPFRQAPGSSSVHSPGIGIGLSLVRRFAELHGGRAWVEERPGGGASFRVILPSG